MTTWPSPSAAEIRTAFKDHGIKRLVEEHDAATRHRSMWQFGLRAMVDHHTAGVGEGVIAYMRNKGGRYPFCNSCPRRDGSLHVFSYGSVWGSGEGSWPYVPKIWANDLLHEVAWQTEIESSGVKPDFTDVQLETLGRQNAALVDLGVPAGNEINHRDWAPRRKIDTLYDIKVLRDNTAKYLRRDDEVALSEEDVQRIAEAVWLRTVNVNGVDRKMGAITVATWKNTKPDSDEAV